MSEWNQRHYKTVTPEASPEKLEYIPANGEIIYLDKIWANAARDPDVKVELKWDGNVIFVTHGDSNQILDEKITGDGVKKLELLFTYLDMVKRLKAISIKLKRK